MNCPRDGMEAGRIGAATNSSERHAKERGTDREVCFFVREGGKERGDAPIVLGVDNFKTKPSRPAGHCAKITGKQGKRKAKRG